MNAESSPVGTLSEPNSGGDGGGGEGGGKGGGLGGNGGTVSQGDCTCCGRSHLGTNSPICEDVAALSMDIPLKLVHGNPTSVMIVDVEGMPLASNVIH